MASSSRVVGGWPKETSVSAQVSFDVMESRPMNVNEAYPPPSGDFSERLVDGLFRRWFLYLIPVAVMAAVGVYAASSAAGVYESYARLDTASNPYVDQPEIRGTAISIYESPAAGTSRLINERLQTDTFVSEVASRAGLTEAIDAGLITPAAIRSRVSASPSGDNNLRLSAKWSDPDTAYLLVDGTVSAYIDYISGVAVADSAEAIEFWTDRKAIRTADVRSAEDVLNSYLAQLPPLGLGQERTTEETLEIGRLNASLDRALAAEQAAQDAIDDAEFTASQLRNTASRNLSVIDAPKRALAPTSVKFDQLLTVVIFTLLGLVIALAALIFSTVADRSVRTRSQIEQAAGIDAIVIPHVKQLRRRRRQRIARSDRAA